MEKPSEGLEAYWSLAGADLLSRLDSAADGLSSADAGRRLLEYGPNEIHATRRRSTASLFFAQYKSPIILILIGAAILALFLKDIPDAVIILVIVFLSGVLGFWQEHSAANAVAKLLEIVQVKSLVIRDGGEVEIPTREVVPGDIVVLDAGDIIPGDGVVLEAEALFVDQAALTGETFPVKKVPSTPGPDTSLADRTNSIFMGTHVVSGDGQAVMVMTGTRTRFGAISQKLKGKQEETEFERGVRRFGFLLLEVTLVLVIAIFAINVFFHKNVLNSLLFSLALAVGLTPQLLPAIISINLAKGARNMAGRKVIVKKLDSIENFGSMDVLCSDKTGTLTAGVVQVSDSIDIEGEKSDKVRLYAYLNAALQTGFANPMDEAIKKLDIDISGYGKLDEVPYDFKRKRLTVLVTRPGGGNLLVTKGAMEQVLALCSRAEGPGEKIVAVDDAMSDIRRQYEELSAQGFRTLGVASRDVGDVTDIGEDDEKDMTFIGLLTLFDPPKEDVGETLAKLASLGVSFKVVTGDNRLVAGHVAKTVGMKNPDVITGEEVARMTGEALARQVEQYDVFAEVEPNEKDRIIRALSRAGNVVGYMGDGINDAPALLAADVGLSVDTAVDVAKEAADFVLLEKDLGVLADGIREGRVTFANTMKYVFMATSANFGNMFSMAGASLFLNFLPLLPGQVLLMNLLTDIPEMTIATDRVDPEMVDKPKRWNISFIRRFMVVFGLLSSVFDYATFGVLMLLLHNSHLTSAAYAQTFRTGWFIESVISASMIVLVIRTRRFFLKSRPSKYLFWSTMGVAVFVIALQYTPLGRFLGFRAIPPYFYPLLAAIIVAYVFSAELAKRLFYRWTKY
jgi:Mg2+-importing ATPase